MLVGIHTPPPARVSCTMFPSKEVPPVVVVTYMFPAASKAGSTNPGASPSFPVKDTKVAAQGQLEVRQMVCGGRIPYTVPQPNSKQFGEVPPVEVVPYRAPPGP